MEERGGRVGAAAGWRRRRQRASGRGEMTTSSYLAGILWLGICCWQITQVAAISLTAAAAARDASRNVLSSARLVHSDYGLRRLSIWKRSASLRRNARSGPDPSPNSASPPTPTALGISDTLEQAAELLDFIEKIEESRSRNTTLSRTRKILPKSSYKFPKDMYERFAPQTRTAIIAANTLNNLFVYSKREATSDESRLYDHEVYYIALARGVVESSGQVLGCGIAFERNQFKDREFFSPYVYRRQGGIHVADLSTSLIYAKDSAGIDWFLSHRRKDFSYVLDSQPVYYELDTKAKDNLSRRWNVSVTVHGKEGYWTQPYYDCRGTKNSTICHWLVTYSIPFFDWEGNKITFKGVVFVDINLDTMDINQCADDRSMFSNTHHCRLETTRCVFTSGGGFRRGFYKCQCSKGFYLPENSTQTYFNGSLVEEEFVKKMRNQSNLYDDAFNCLPCHQGCEECTGLEPCYVEFNILIRGIPLGIQSFCITITIVLAFVIIRLRKTKVMVTSMWIMLEILLVGALLLYSTVVIQYFEPTSMTCLLIPWFREMGFAVLYGALILKLYRLLSEFQSRKAHRVHVRDKDLLKYLLCIILVVAGFMTAWTTLNLDLVPLEEGGTLLQVGQTPEGLKYSICKPLWWDYVIEVIEFLFLCFGIYLCYCTRSAPSDYGEGKYVSAAIYNETVSSTVLHIVRHILWDSLHPDYVFLMYFLRCQVTVTIALILVLGPKLWFAHRPPEDDHFRNRAYSTSDVHDNVSPEAIKFNVAISSNGDVDVGEINLAEMDPEDIRSELKRLYTQLQIYRTKTMCRDNPHISKRRGGRKQTHRRFSIQTFHKRHHHERDHDHEISKTPEESTNSAEVTIPMEATSRGDDHSHEGREGRSLPTVTFKTGHK